MNPGTDGNKLMEVAQRIREMREIMGLSQDEMASKTGVSPEDYRSYEAGRADFPFTFIYKCALTLGVEITDLMEGSSAPLTGYTVTRSGGGQMTALEGGHEIKNLAPLFRRKIAEPYIVRYAYSEKEQRRSIPTATHSGQEFDLILEGSLMVRVGEHTEVLNAGDSIYYDSSNPHGMIAVGGSDCLFCAVVLPGAQTQEEELRKTVAARPAAAPVVSASFISTVENSEGVLRSLSFKNTEKFNFAFDIVDALAGQKPDKLAMLHISRTHGERRFTFREMSRESNRTANYFKSLGIKKGDRVMLVLKRHYQFWFCILALHKLGAIAIPATHQLQEKDYEYRFNAAEVGAIVCTADEGAAEHAERAAERCPGMKLKIMVGGRRGGWRDFDEEYSLFSTHFTRPADAACGGDPMLMFFTSGTTGQPKIALHPYTYPLGHFITAKYWHCVNPDGLHFTIADTGWGKALWGKLYGQWLCEAAVFTYDFDHFDANDILPMFKRYNITTFCAPPTIYRLLIREDLSSYDLSSLEHATIAGEALNPEVFNLFYRATGLELMEGFGQTETTLLVGNYFGMTPKAGSMGKPSVMFDVDIVSSEGVPVKMGEIGEIVVRTAKGTPYGLFSGYYKDEAKTHEAWHDGLYHTGDTAWRDEDGYYWYVGRMDDIIKSSGYRIGPFEIESVIMELPYVLECGVTSSPDPVRGQVVRACIVLTRDTAASDELKKEIQDYVKNHTAPYKYPRIVEFRKELPKTISGKIQRNRL